MIIKKLLASIVLFSTIIHANTCPEWLPLSTGDITIVMPIYDKSITGPDMDCDEILDSVDTDIDGDGVPNTSDAFPTNSSESIDTDGDGIGNNADIDDDNDGLTDIQELALGTNPLLKDTDGDGINDKDDPYPLGNTPVLEAQNDTITSSSIEATTVDVLSNDTLPAEGINTLLITSLQSVNSTPNYSTEVFVSGGRFVVVNNQIGFLPSSFFPGGDAQINYQITDSNGNVSTAELTIKYPVIIKALSDTHTATSVTPVTVNVMDNDIIASGETGSIFLLQDSTDGTWNVVNNQVVFTPTVDFGGGIVSQTYALTSDNIHYSYSTVEITYPTTLDAQPDELTKNSIGLATVDVLSNDILQAGETNTILFKTWDPNGIEEVETDEGNWTINNNQVIFTPNTSFIGGTVSIKYKVQDSSGLSSVSNIYIYYPSILNALSDFTTTSTHTPKTIDVLANDTITDGSSGTILFQNWEGEFVTSFVDNSGVWTIDNNQVLFTPNTDFNGGLTNITYQLSDESGHVDTASINIEFPVIIQAQYDSVSPTSIEATTIDALANDIITDGSSGTILLQDPVSDEFVTFIETNDGNWSIVNNKVLFTPSASFNGGWTSIWYQLSDQSGHTDTEYIGIEFPL